MFRRLTAARVDLLLAPVLVALYEVQVAVLHGVGPNRVLSGLAGAAVCAGVAVRRRFPMVVGLLTQAILTATVDHVDLPAGPLTIAWFCALYGMAVWTTKLQFAVAVPFVLLANARSGLWTDPNSAGVNFGLGAAAAMVLVRIAIGGRDRRLRLAERERELAAREAVVGERERIARELHDVIGHHVSTMVVQAGAERRMLSPDQDETREVLGTIERVGRGALDEMRRMVAMLRRDPDHDLLPQPTLADVPTLVGELRSAGLAVELRIEGEPRELPAGIGLSAYRIVQEALTNALKHAPSSSTSVLITYHADALALVVRDDGTATLPGTPDGGHGLIGMRERVAMYGGSFEAGQQAGGGFAVRVELPAR